MPAKKEKVKAPKTNVFICQPSYRQACGRDLRTVIDGFGTSGGLIAIRPECRRVLADISLGRLGEPGDPAPIAVFLVSDKSKLDNPNTVFVSRVHERFL